MSLNNLLTTINDNLDIRNHNQIIETSAYIEVTKKTVRFGAAVFQFHNITGFSLSCVGKKKIIPWVIIVIGMLWSFWMIPGSMIIFFDLNKFLWGIIIFILSGLGIAVNVLQPLRYGFQLEVNSGYSRTFVTKDLDGVTRIVSKLYELMEKETDNIYKINIDQRHASIGIGYAEKINVKKIGGSIYNNDD